MNNPFLISFTIITLFTIVALQFAYIRHYIKSKSKLEQTRSIAVCIKPSSKNLLHFYQLHNNEITICKTGGIIDYSGKEYEKPIYLGSIELKDADKF
jgi:hypothetical protein